MANRIFTAFIPFLVMWVSLEAASTGFPIANSSVLKSYHNGNNITRFDTNGGMSISFISDRNEVIIHGSPKETETALRHIEKKVTLLDWKYHQLSTAFKSLDGRILVLEKADVTLHQIQGKLNATTHTINTVFQNVTELEAKLQKVTGLVQQRLDALNKTNGELLQKIQALEISQKKGYTLLFPRKGTSDYVIVRNRIPSLSAFTVCFWMKSTDSGNDGTPLSYAVTGSDNELVLYNYKKFALWVKSDSRATSVSANDGKWHHICATWANTAGSWKLYKDGKVAASGQGLKRGQVIRAGGFLVLGQEQDSPGGRFDANQNFIGELTGVNIWNRVLSDNEVLSLSKSCLGGEGNVLKWADFRSHDHIRGGVQSINSYCNA